MKLKAASAMVLSAISITMTLTPVLSVSAGNDVLLIENVEKHFENISPRYSYIQSADIGVYPSQSETSYSMNIRGISEVTGVSGTMTLYKKSASGKYEEVESENINLSGSTIFLPVFIDTSG